MSIHGANCVRPFLFKEQYLKLITPGETANNLQEISLDPLIARGFKLLLLDIDNTIVPRGDKEAAEEILEWLKDARVRGLKICLMSNNTKKHFPDLEGFVDDYSIFSKKPFKMNYERLLNKFGVDTSQAVMIGDQIFTDVLGANRMGIYTILTRRQRNYGKFIRKILHWAEDRLWIRFEK